MAHKSETGARLAGFLHGNIGVRGPEGRFNAAPMNLDAHTPDGNVEAPKRDNALLHSPKLAQFAPLFQGGAEASDTRTRSFSEGGGGSFKLGSLIGLLVASGLFAAGEAFKIPELFLFGAIVMGLTAILMMFSTILNWRG